MPTSSSPRWVSSARTQTFAGMKAVAILGLHFADGVEAIVPLRFLIGANAAGLAIIVESWLNALVPNEQRGRVLTIYVLVYGLFFGAGQLLGQNLKVRGPEMLFIAGIATTLALVPMVAINVRAPVMPQRRDARDTEGAAHLAGERAGVPAERPDPHGIHDGRAPVRRAHRLRPAAHRDADGLRVARADCSCNGRSAISPTRSTGGMPSSAWGPAYSRSRPRW